MHGIKEIKDFNKEHQEAERILAGTKTRDVDRDYLIRQQALDNYLRDKYGSPSFKNY
jgi:hypothetical protein